MSCRHIYATFVCNSKNRRTLAGGVVIILDISEKNDVYETDWFDRAGL